jgi:hypothetical protein
MIITAISRLSPIHYISGLPYRTRCCPVYIYISTLASIGEPGAEELLAKNVGSALGPTLSLLPSHMFTCMLVCAAVVTSLTIFLR